MSHPGALGHPTHLRSYRGFSGTQDRCLYTFVLFTTRIHWTDLSVNNNNGDVSILEDRRFGRGQEIRKLL